MSARSREDQISSKMILPKSRPFVKPETSFLATMAACLLSGGLREESD
jgi:hypothetical protein